VGDWIVAMFQSNKLAQWLSATVISLIVIFSYPLSSQALYTVNSGDTLILETQSGIPYTISDSSVIINGLVRIYEINGSGVRTGNGGYLVINSSGGINLGSTGSLNANAAILGGNGGFITLNGSTLTINGLITTNGLGSGRGGVINLIGNTIDIGSVAVLSARSGSSSSYGGKIDIDGSGLVTVANGATLATSGLSNGTSNLIEISGAGVNLDGLVNATGVGSGDGGTVTIIATTSGTFIGNTSQVLAYSSNGNGGSVNLDGNVTVEGSVQAHSGANGKTGGVITITGSNTESLTVQNGGILYVNGRTGTATSTGNAGTIDVDTGSVNLANGYVKAEGGWNGGHAGTIDIRSTNGNITVGNGMQVLATGDTAGTVLLSATGGNVNINSGGAVKSQGDTSSTLTLSGNAITVAGLLEAGGWQDNNGGTLNITSNTTDVTISSGGVVSSRGGSLAATNGGDVNINASRDIILSGATSGSDNNRPNDAHIRVYGNAFGGTLGQGGVITLTAGDDFLANEYVTVNANGTSVPSGSTFTKSVINITAANTATIDGIYQAGGRLNSNGGGGLINITAGNNITIDATSALKASVSDVLVGATGDGGRIDITSTNGNIGISGGSTVIGGVTRGLMDFSSGTTGDGGQLNITANNGIITLAGVNLNGSGGSNGGVINLLASSNINIDALSSLITSGIATATKNRIIMQGNSVSMLGSLTATSSAGGGGYVQIVNNGAAITGSPAAGINVNGSTQGGTIYLTGTSVDTAGNYNYGDAHVVLEGTTGNVIVDQTLTARELTLKANGSTVSANADFSNVGMINASGNVISITGSSGNMAIGNMTSTGNTTLLASNGSMTLGSGKTLTSSGGALSMTTGAGSNGNITNSGAALSGASGITLSADGNLTGTSGSYSGTITATADNISLTASSGNMSGGNMSAQSIALTTNSGDYTQISGTTLTSKNGNDGGSVSINANGSISFAGSGGTDIDVTANTTNGGLGGGISLTAGQNVTLTGNLDSRGYLRTSNSTGHGGNITISAGSAYVQNSASQLLLSSDYNGAVNGATRLNGNGGNTSISANSIQINASSADYAIISTGHNNTKNNQDGGNGGTVTLTSTTFIDLNSTLGKYTNTSGGTAGKNGIGGSGGNVNLNHAVGQRTIDLYNSSVGSTGSFYRSGGTFNGGSGSNGTNGVLYFNGVAQ